MTQLYVYNEILVTKTGRTATKTVQKQTLKSEISKESIIIEVQPVDIEDGTWKRWVAEKDLFVVSE